MEDHLPEFTERVGEAVDVFTVCTDFIFRYFWWAVPLHVLGEVYY